MSSNWQWSHISTDQIVEGWAGGRFCLSKFTLAKNSLSPHDRTPIHTHTHTSYMQFLFSVNATGINLQCCISVFVFCQYTETCSIHAELTWLQPAVTAGRLEWTGIERSGRRWDHTAFYFQLKQKGDNRKIEAEQKWLLCAAGIFYLILKDRNQMEGKIHLNLIY